MRNIWAAIVAAFLAASLLGANVASVVVPAMGGTPWTQSRIARLDADLDAMIAADPALRGAHYGISVVDTATGATLYGHGSREVIMPASTMKLIVGSAALDRLGPTFRFRTTLALGHPAGLQSSLPVVVLRMGGDPTFTRADIAAGIATLTGVKLLGYAAIDDSVFDAKPYADGWTWDDFAEAYAPKISAATVDENVLPFVVSPGPRVGSPAVVTSSDGHPFSAPSQCTSQQYPFDFVRSNVTTGSAGSEDTLELRAPADACTYLVGSVAVDAAPETIQIAARNPLSVAYLDLNASVGIRIGVAGGNHMTTSLDADDDYRPYGAPLMEEPFWIHDSAPLSELLGPRFWIPSDNLFGENLLKTIGHIVTGAPGTTDNGIAFEKAWLQSIGIDPATVTLADGCGMSQYDRITARDLVTILQHDWRGPNRQLILDSLPVGGARGTIEGIAGTPAQGRVFAKTGSMMHVRGLAGYLATVHHGAVTFAFEVDDWNGDYKSLATLRAEVLSRIISD